MKKTRPSRARALFVASGLLWAAPAFCQRELPERCLTNHPANDRCASYSPDGSRIVFESDRNGNWDIFVMDKDGGNARPITSDTTAERQPSWHPSGKKILFESNREGSGRLFLFDLESEILEKIEAPGLPAGDIMFGKYAPDGQRLAFSVRFSDSVFHVFLLETTSKKWRQLTSGNFRHTFPNWSPNGKSLTFHARHETGNLDDEIYTLRLRSGKMRRLTKHPKHNFCPAWSPDGEQIAFVSSMENTATEIFLINKDGRNERRITQNALGEVLPSWHPSGHKLLVSAWRDGNYEICEISLD